MRHGIGRLASSAKARRRCFTLAIAAFLALALPQAARAIDELRFFRIGTAATTGTYFQLGGVLASAISKPPGARECEHGGSCGVTGLIAVAEATAGSTENVLGVGSGQLESALAQADVAWWAFNGSTPPAPPRCREAQAPAGFVAQLKSKGALQNLRAIAALYPEDIHIVVRADGPLHSLRDLKGQRVALGEPGSGTVADARLALAAAGLSDCDLKPRYLPLSQAAEALSHGDIDAFFIVAGYPVPAVVDVATTVPIRLLPIAGAALAKLQRTEVYVVADSIPAGTYPGIDEDVPTASVKALWIVGADLPDDLAYAITKALWQDATRKLLDASHPAAKRIRLDTALTGEILPLHPGAARYYSEAGMELPAATPTPN